MKAWSVTAGRSAGPRGHLRRQTAQPRSSPSSPRPHGRRRRSALAACRPPPELPPGPEPRAPALRGGFAGTASLHTCQPCVRSFSHTRTRQGGRLAKAPSPVSGRLPSGPPGLCPPCHAGSPGPPPLPPPWGSNPGPGLSLLGPGWHPRRWPCCLSAGPPCFPDPGPHPSAPPLRGPPFSPGDPPHAPPPRSPDLLLLLRSLTGAEASRSPVPRPVARAPSRGHSPAFSRTRAFPVFTDGWMDGSFSVAPPHHQACSGRTVAGRQSSKNVLCLNFTYTTVPAKKKAMQSAKYKQGKNDGLKLSLLCCIFSKTREYLYQHISFSTVVSVRAQSLFLRLDVCKFDNGLS